LRFVTRIDFSVPMEEYFDWMVEADTDFLQSWFALPDQPSHVSLTALR
jgi:hypothetical protein